MFDWVLNTSLKRICQSEIFVILMLWKFFESSSNRLLLADNGSNFVLKVQKMCLALTVSLFSVFTEMTRICK